MFRLVCRIIRPTEVVLSKYNAARSTFERAELPVAPLKKASHLPNVPDLVIYDRRYELLAI